MKALKKHLNLLTRLAEGDKAHNELARGDVNIRMICNDHGYYGDISFDFHVYLTTGKPGQRWSRWEHVLTYEAQLAYGKAKPGLFTTQSDRVEHEKVIKQFKAALAELNYPVVAESWTIINEADKSVYAVAADAEDARLKYDLATVNEVPVSLWHKPAGAEAGDIIDWNCDLDTGEFDKGEYEPLEKDSQPEM